jgi:hypothetical protein
MVNWNRDGMIGFICYITHNKIPWLAPTHMAFRIPPRFFRGFWTPRRYYSMFCVTHKDLQYLISFAYTT